jgi:hypothetical protein
MYGDQAPAPTRALNVVPDHPHYGDERNFVVIRSVTGNTTEADIVRANVGDELRVTAVVHNNAANSLPPEESTIHGLKMRFTMGQNTTDNPVRIIIEADNAAAVWDSASVVTPVKTSLQFISGSIKFKTNHAKDPKLSVPDGKFAQGHSVLLGQEELNGQLPVGYDKDGVYQGAGIAEFRLVVVPATEQ